MPEIHEPNIRQKDAWLSILALFSLLTLSGFVICPTLEMILGRSTFALWYISMVPAYLIPILYLSVRYGRVGALDFFLTTSDLPILLISFIIVVIAFSIISTVQPYDSSALRGRLSLLSETEFIITALIFFLVGPFLEETFFRRYIYEIFGSKYGAARGILLTAFVETLGHFGYWDVKFLILVLLLMIFLNVVYSRSRLVVSIIMHSLINIFIYYF